MNQELRQLVAQTFLSSLPDEVTGQLVAGAERHVVAAGTRACVPGTPSVVLLERGLMRIAMQGSDGRAITQRYLHRADIAGIPTIFYGTTFGDCQAIVDTSFYRMRTEVWLDLAKRDVRVANALLEEVCRILVVSLTHLVSGSLSSMRQRVARELLDIAADHQVGSALVAPVTQQQLADGIGSVREVVARALRELRDAGAVATGPEGIVIVDPQELRAQLEVVA